MKQEHQAPKIIKNYHQKQQRNRRYLLHVRLNNTSSKNIKVSIIQLIQLFILLISKYKYLSKQDIQHRFGCAAVTGAFQDEDGLQLGEGYL